jgi:hypothetical protein
MFKQNITDCRFINNSGGSGNDIYFGGSNYPADKLMYSCSSSEAVKIYSTAGSFDSYLPPCVSYVDIYLAASGLFFCERICGGE